MSKTSQFKFTPIYLVSESRKVCLPEYCGYKFCLLSSDVCAPPQVIPVEVESASRGFLMFQLGVNRGDVPESVAATFCDKHGLGPE